MKPLWTHSTDSRRGITGFALASCVLAWLVVVQPAMADEPALDAEVPVTAPAEAPDTTVETPVGGVIAPETDPVAAPPGEEIPTPAELVTILSPVEAETEAPVVANPAALEPPQIIVVDTPPVDEPAAALAPPALAEIPPTAAPSPGLTADAIQTASVAAPAPAPAPAPAGAVDFGVRLPEAPPDVPAAPVVEPATKAAHNLTQESSLWTPPAPPSQGEPPMAPLSTPKQARSTFAISVPEPVSFVVPSGGFLQLLVAYIAPGELSQAALPPLTQLLMVLVALALVRPRPRAERVADRHRRPLHGHHGLVLRPG